MRLVRLALASMSTARTRYPLVPHTWARLLTSVVFPAPPLRLSACIRRTVAVFFLVGRVGVDVSLVVLTWIFLYLTLSEIRPSQHHLAKCTVEPW